MTNQAKTKQSFYLYLQKHYTGKLVAYSKQAKVVYATGKNVKELTDKLKKKKTNFKDIVFTGPIPKSNRTYVYFISLCIKRDRRRNNS